MNVQLLISAVLILLGALIHTIGGEITDIRQLMASRMPTNLKIELRMSWYLAAIDMAVSGVYLLVIALTGDVNGAELFVSFTALRVTLYGVMAFLLLVITQRDHLLKIPQWILLIAIGVLAWFGIN